jgi:hypothetical protein
MMLLAVLALALAAPVAVQAEPASPPPAATPVDPARLAIGRELVAIVLPPAQREQMMTSVMNSMMGAMAASIEGSLGKEINSDPEKAKIFHTFLERQQALALEDVKTMLPDLVEAYAHAYARNFTLDELTQTKAFMSTPAGAKFMQRGPALLSDPDGTALLTSVMARGMVRQKAEIRKLTDALKSASKKG